MPFPIRLRKTRLQIRLQDDSLWLTQKQIADLFERSNKTISEHINNIYGEGELEPDSTIRKFRTVALEGTREVERLLDHYNLDAVLSVGYRVRSVRGTQFRKWANQVLKAYLIKGFAMDDERRFYQKITDIYATVSDYNKGAPVSHSFFATVQNKLHWAIHGHTAAELVQERAHSELKGLNRVVTMYLDFAELVNKSKLIKKL